MPADLTKARNMLARRNAELALVAKALGMTGKWTTADLVREARRLRMAEAAATGRREGHGE